MYRKGLSFHSNLAGISSDSHSSGYSVRCATLKRRKRFKAIIIQPETTLGDTLQSTPQAIQSRHLVLIAENQRRIKK